MKPALFEARGIVKHYTIRGRKRTVLPGVSLVLGPGKILAILGPSGCGKSTLLNIMAGFCEADQGSVLLRGETCRSPGPDRAMVFQEDALFPWLTALENITLGLRAAGMPKQARIELAQRMLQRVGLAGFERHLPKALSGGMRQRLALARTLALEPSVLLMDEPFAALDAITREQMHELLISLHGLMRMSILLVTHDVAEAVCLADTLLVMGRAGQGLTGEFSISLPRPRSRTEPECLDITQTVHNLLRTHAAGCASHARAACS